jgi:hypothetical protein
MQQQSRDGTVNLQVKHRPAEQSLERGDEQGACDRGHRRREQKPTKIREQIGFPGWDQVFLDPFGQKRALE